MQSRSRIINDKNLIYIIVLILLITPITNRDIFWQLKAGEYIITYHKIPKTQLFNFVDNNMKWVDHEWLSQIIFYSIYKLSGFYGLIFLKIAIILLVFYLMFKIIDKTEDSLLRLLVFTAAVLLFSKRFVVRPEIFSYLLILWYVYLIEKEKFQWWHSFFVIVWANLHPAFIIINIVFFVYYLFSLNRRFLIALLISLISGLINPYGIELYKRLFLEMKSPMIKYFISEWNSPSLFITQGNINFYIILYLIFLVLVVFVIIRKIILMRRIGALETITLLFLLLSLNSLRFISFFAIFSMIAVAHLLSKVKCSRLVAIGICIGISIAIFSGALYPLLGEEKYFGLGLNRHRFTKAVIDFIGSKKIGRGNIFVDYGNGGFISFYFYPKARVFIDGSYITEENIRRYLKILARPYRISDYDMNLFCLDYTNPSVSNLIDYLFTQGFKFVFLDDRFAVFLPSSASAPDTVQISGVDNKKMLYRKTTFMLKYNMAPLARDLLLKNMDKVNKEYYLLNNLGVAYVFLKDYNSAERVFKRSLQLKKRQFDANYNLGLLYIELKKYKEALYHLSSAYNIKPDAKTRALIQQLLKIRKL